MTGHNTLPEAAPPLSTLSNEELLKLRGEQAYLAQMSALEGMEPDATVRQLADALQAELQRRGL